MRLVCLASYGSEQLAIAIPNTWWQRFCDRPRIERTGSRLLNFVLPTEKTRIGAYLPTVTGGSQSIVCFACWNSV